MAGSQAKLYLMDPLLMRLPHLVDAGFCDQHAPALSGATLAIVAGRAVDDVHPGRLLDGRAVAYVRTGSGNEVDIAPLPVRVGGVDTATVPIESKWVSTGWRSAALTMENKYGRGVLATKDILDLSHPVWAIPAGAVALLLG